MRRLTSRPELLLLLVLIVGCAFLPNGLPAGIAGLGVVSGSLLALQAMGIVLLYTRTRVLSFAQFGLGAAASVLFYLWVLYNQWAVLANGVCGCLAPPGASMSRLQHRPDLFRSYLADHHPWALVVNALISAGIGAFLASDSGRQVYQAIAGVFLRAPRIVPTVATLAFAIVLSGAAGLLTLRTTSVFGLHPFGWFPYGPRPGTGINGRPAVPEGVFEPPFHRAWEFTASGGARFHVYDELTVLAAAATFVLLTLRFRYGRRGLASRAVAANLERAATLGLDVVAETRGPWRVAGAMSGLGGVLSVSLSASPPSVGLDMAALTNVLAAVVLARLASLGWALVASIGLGVLAQGMYWNFHSLVEFDASLVLVVAAALLLQRGRASRAERDSEAVFTSAPEPVPVLPQLRRTAGVQGLLRFGRVTAAVIALGYPIVTTPRQLSLGIGVVAYAVTGLSLLVLSGWAGQVSLGQLSLGAVAAYVVAVSAVSWHLPMPLALVLGALVSAAIAPLVGFPALRLPGPFVAIMTLGLALAVPAVLLDGQLLGASLPANLPRPVLLGLDLSSDRYFYYFSLLVLAAAVALVTGLRRGRLRRASIAARDNAAAAAAFGVDVTRLRLEAFAVSGLVAGLGGGLLAYANGSVVPDAFSSLNSVVLFLIVVIGGLGALSGPILGAAVLGLVQPLGAAWVGLLNGLGTLFVLSFRPGGLAGILASVRDAAVRVALHINGFDLTQLSPAGRGRIPLADAPDPTSLVPVRYRLVGDGFGPVEGTRLRPVAGVTEQTGSAAGSFDDAHTSGLAEQVDAAMSALSCHRLEVAYGALTVLRGVSLTVAPGEVLAVVGLNGAGKTSLLRALAGLEPAARGSVSLSGDDVTRELPQDRAKRGVTFVPGGDAVLPTLTVAENLAVVDGAPARVDELLDAFPALRARLDTAAGNLSGGEQQVLALVQALLRDPRVLLVDELSLGLSPEAMSTVLDQLRGAAGEGTAVVVVEQSISRAMSIADTAVFLDSGEVRYQGPARALREHPELFASVAFGATAVGVGSELARAARMQRTEREPVLVADQLSASYGPVRVVDGVHLEVGSGEVVGILGPNGAGKTSLFDCLAGVLSPDEGTVSLLGQDVTRMAPHRRAALGLMRSYQSARLFPSLTVRDCIGVALETRLTSRSAAVAGLWLPPARAQERRVNERVDELVELLNLQQIVGSPVGSLSLGARRMVDLACQLAARPRVLLLDEPAAGLAHSEMELIGPLVSRISSDLDCAVLIIDHNVQVLASVAHRLVAMRAGAVIAEGEPAAVLSDPAVLGSYFGAETTTGLARAT